MEFLWECMLLAWKGMIGFFLWIILFAIGGTMIANGMNILDKLFLRSLLNQMKIKKK